MSTIQPTCAIALSTKLLGDKWSLLILRDMILHNKTRFKDFMSSKEKIATNILSSRLKFLTENNFIEILNENSTKKNRQYVVTEKGISTLPIIMELYLFSINFIDESKLNSEQIKIKNQICRNRRRFEKLKKNNCLNYISSLRTEIISA